MGAQEPAFEERYDKMSELQWFVSNTGIFALHNAIVSRRFKPAISMPTICPNRATFLDRCFDKWDQTPGGCVGHDRHSDAPNSLVCFIFHGNNNQGFTPSPSTPFPGLVSAYIRLINLNNTSKPITSRPHHSCPHLMQPRPSRLIAAHTKNSFQSQGADTVLLSSYPPDRSEPHRQGFVCILENCSSNYRHLVTTFRALIKYRPNRISFIAPTARATKSVWPSNLTKIITTGHICWKHDLEFLEVFGIFCHTPKYYMLWVA